MVVLSKCADKYVLHGFTCYEVGHTWTTSCLQSWKDVGVSSYKTALKIYLPLYLLALVLRRRNQLKKSSVIQDILKMIPELLRSTFFLGTNGLSFIVAFCLWRKCFPFYYFFQVFTCGTPCSALALALERPDRLTVSNSFTLVNAGFLPALMGSMLSISFERKQRRGLLAVYMANIAVETLYLMLKSRKLVRPLPYGEVLLFSLSTSLFFYMYQIDCVDGSLKSGIRFLLGDVDRRSAAASQPKSPLSSYLPKWAQACLRALPGIPSNGCHHADSCLANAIGKFARMFAFGFGLQSALRLAAALPALLARRSGRAGRSGGGSAASAIGAAAFHRDSLQFGLFLGGLPSIYHACRCLLRRLSSGGGGPGGDGTGADRPWHAAASGLAAGLSLAAYRSSSVAMYTASKAVELLCTLGVRAGRLPRLPHADILLYAVSTAVVFHCAVFEPHSLRPAYWRFLLRMTDGRFAFINRRILDALNGGHSSSLYPDFWPDYDPGVTSLHLGPEELARRLKG